MIKSFQIVFNAIVLSLLLISPASFAAEPLPAYSKVYDPNRDPFKDATAAITLATETNRNVLIEIGGTWCTWCEKIDAFLADNPDIYEKLHNNFVLLKVSVSDENENEKFMSGFPPVLGYPHMYVSTSKGKVILSKDTADFLQSGQYSRKQWIDFIEQFKFDNNSVNIEKQKKLSAKKKTNKSSQTKA